MQVKSIIIDDDIFLATVLRDMLVEDYPHIEVTGMAHSGAEGIHLIESAQPQLVFLDVEMPDMNGFEMLSLLKEINFQIIFITAHSHYAIKAIRFNALDYLVKPIDAKELRQSLKRFTVNPKKSLTPQRVELALFNLQQNNAGEQVLLLQLQDGDVQIKLNQIARIEGERNYSYIHLAGGSKKLSAKNLAYFEEILSEKGFCRCHKSHLVGARHIQALQKEAFITQGQEVPISRRKKKEVKAWYARMQSEGMAPVR